MEGFEIKEIAYLIIFIASIVTTFLGTRYKIKEYVRDKHDELKDQISDLRHKMSELKSKDDLQQQVINQIGKQMDDLIPRLLDALKEKKENERD